MRTRRSPLPAIAAVVMFLSGARLVQAGIVYVSPSGNDASNNGSSWATAKRTVHTGLNTAVSGDQIWVKAGTYIECVTLKSGVALYGGFSGNETALSQRNWVVNVTILDAKASCIVVTSPSGATHSTRIDGFTICNGKSGLLVGGGIYCYSSSPTISNNNITANSNVGIGCYSSSAVISNNIIIGNTATGFDGPGYGGGIRCFNSSPVIVNNTIIGNAAGLGGGISCSYSSSPIIANNTIVGNSAEFGGGAFCESDSCPVFVNNIAAFNSSGLYNRGGAPELSYNCVFNPGGTNYTGLADPTGIDGNISADPQLLASAYGEVHQQAVSPCIDVGMDSVVQSDWADMDGQPRIQGAHVDIGADEFIGASVTFTPAIVRVCLAGDDANNGCTWSSAKRTVQAGINAVSEARGGEVWVADGTYSERITLKQGAHIYGGFAGSENSREQRNAMIKVTILDGGGSGSVIVASAPGYGWNVVDGFTIQNGVASQSVGGGINCSFSSPIISNNNIIQNKGPGIYCSYSCPTVSKNMIAKCANGIRCLDYSSPTIKNNTLTENVAGSNSNGGGIYCYQSAGMIERNSIIGNYNGGIDCYSSAPVISNNLIIGNKRLAGNGGGICCRSSSPTISNNVIVGNSANYGGGGGIYFADYSSPIISNNTITGNSARFAGGMYCSSSSYYNATISNNIIAFNSSGVQKYLGMPTFRNNCVFNPNGVNYTGITDPTGVDGNISADPHLVASEYGEVHLKDGSPCIDAGLDSIVQSHWCDMDDQLRVQGAHVDIGAYEFSGTTSAFAPAIVRVSLSGNDGNDGLSWSSAKRTVQAAIDAASAARGGEVWVMHGTYIELLTLKQWVHMYGGFAGFESNRDQRNWVSNETILDGGGKDLVVNSSAPGFGWNVIDGFTIQNGNGSGVYCSFSAPRISNNTIIGNAGGGVYCKSCYAVISNCTIMGNNASAGGGIYCSYSSSRISNNVILANAASSNGGGIYCTYSLPNISNNIIDANIAGGNGGGIYCMRSSPTISNNVISGNAHSGVYSTNESSPVIRSNTISLNSSSGIYLDNPFSATSVWNNIVAFNANGVYVAGTLLSLGNNCVYNPGGANYSGLGAGAGDISVDPLFGNWPAGDYHLSVGSPCIDAGYNADVSAGVLTDLDGHLRFFDDPATPDCQWSPGNCGTAPIVDMGAYEFIPVIRGDFDRDGDVDLDDLGALRVCVSGPAVAYSGDCMKADFDHDNDVDQDDFGVVQRCYSGSGHPANPNCGN